MKICESPHSSGFCFLPFYLKGVLPPVLALVVDIGYKLCTEDLSSMNVIGKLSCRAWRSLWGTNKYISGKKMQYNRLLTSLCARANIKKSSTHSWQQYCEFLNLHHKFCLGNCLQKALIIKSAEQQIVNVEIVETKMTNSKKYVFIEQQRKGQRHWLVRASFRPLSGEAWDGEEDEERGWQRELSTSAIQRFEWQL